MEITIFWSDKLKAPHQSFQLFVQKMANRILQGHARYGLPNKRQKYLTCLKLELKAYEKTGNGEHLVNLANYAGLEAECPEHPKFHWDSFVDSATRKYVPSVGK